MRGKRTGNHSSHNKREVRAAAALPATRYVCFEATVQKIHVYPGDREDGAALRQRAYAACGVESAPAPWYRRYIVLEERGERTKGGKATRRITNGAQLRAWLDALSARLGLWGGVRAEELGRLSYCGQVQLMAGAAMLIGMHG